MAASEVRESIETYSDEEQPFAGYLTLSGVFNVALGTALVAAHRRGRVPDRLSVDDVVRMGFATHKLARVLTKDSVTSFARAPFVRLEDRKGTNTVQEKPRGQGFRRSIGELVACPECMGQWIAGGFLAGMLHAPRTTRAITSMYTALALADMLQFVYTGLKDRA